MPRLRDKASRFVKGPGFAYIAVVALLTVGVYEKSSQDAQTLRQKFHHDAQALRRSQIAGCERGDADRVDHASVYRQMATYYNGVVHAASVGADVHLIAVRVRNELSSAAAGQESRILLCVPLIDDGRKVPDRRLLRRLSGH